VSQIEPGSPEAQVFSGALADLCRDLAQQVVRDGEGLTKFVEITVTGAVSDASAKRIAASVANSPLVKTALAGEDANWGRVVMAVGKAGEPADRDRLSIYFGPHRVAKEGERDPSYSEPAVAAYMKNTDLTIRIDLALGGGDAVIWTCDLTAEYVAINADYRS
jgi:glutamate N-acetyltransferase/amino-acid N-acetyltransferase